jgi:signal peptidase I
VTSARLRPVPALAGLAGATVIGAAMVASVMRRRLVEVTISGMSMAPHLVGGERVLLRRAPLGAVRRGDVVVVGYTPPDQVGPDVTRLWLVKRVAAVAGDPVPAEVAAATGAPAGSPVPAGHLVVLGDNPDGSLDSRTCGFFGGDSLLGVMVRKLDRSGQFRGDESHEVR